MKPIYSVEFEIHVTFNDGDYGSVRVCSKVGKPEPSIIVSGLDVTESQFNDLVNRVQALQRSINEAKETVTDG